MLAVDVDADGAVDVDVGVAAVSAVVAAVVARGNILRCSQPLLLVFVRRFHRNTNSSLMVTVIHMS